jgi:hypothetical protein
MSSDRKLEKLVLRLPSAFVPTCAMVEFDEEAAVLDEDEETVPDIDDAPARHAQAVILSPSR